MAQKHPLIAYSDRTGKTVTAIAKEAGCSRMTLYRLINGEQNATLGLLARISAATGGEVPINAFLPAPVLPASEPAAPAGEAA